jgi:asparagine synthase (glutamine-hydrolysing)
MANSLEVRVPFLNQQLLEFAGKLPRRFKLHRLTRKYLLRLAFKDVLPPAILRRGKKGFNMPVARWLTGPLQPLAAELFAEERLKRGGLFHPRYVRSLWAEHLSRRRDHRKLLWTLLVFELWREKWL